MSTPIGASVNQQDSVCDTIYKVLQDKIRVIVDLYGLDDSKWSKAISSQYFWLCLAQQLNYNQDLYQNLLDKCLSNFSVHWNGEILLDGDKLEITPDETERIRKCMLKEDESETLYSLSEKNQAKNIRIEQMHLNFHNGLLVRIASLMNNDTMNNIRDTCLNQLICKEAIDPLGGWYPFRVPWITSRILISLRNINLDSFLEKNKLTTVIDAAIYSLFKHIDNSTPYWRSGVGEWVSKWESTGLCLEAVFLWDRIETYNAKVNKIIEYVCLEDNISSWLAVPGFSTEEQANSTLSATVLASVIYRMTNTSNQELFLHIQHRILSYFSTVLDLIHGQKVDFIKQDCTVPQILHYICSAIPASIYSPSNIIY